MLCLWNWHMWSVEGEITETIFTHVSITQIQIYSILRKNQETRAFDDEFSTLHIYQENLSFCRAALIKYSCTANPLFAIVFHEQNSCFMVFRFTVPITCVQCYCYYWTWQHTLLQISVRQNDFHQYLWILIDLD